MMPARCLSVVDMYYVILHEMTDDRAIFMSFRAVQTVLWALQLLWNG